MEKYDLHNHKRRLCTELKLVSKRRICERNKKDLLKYADLCKARGLTTGRVYKIVYTVRMIMERIGKDFRKLTKDDIIKFVGEIDKFNNKKCSI